MQVLCCPHAETVWTWCTPCVDLVQNVQSTWPRTLIFTLFITDNAVGRLEPRQLDGKAASLVPGKLEGNTALPEPGQFDGKTA